MKLVQKLIITLISTLSLCNTVTVRTKPFFNPWYKKQEKVQLTPENTAFFFDCDDTISKRGWRYRPEIIAPGIKEADIEEHLAKLGIESKCIASNTKKINKLDNNNHKLAAITLLKQKVKNPTVRAFAKNILEDIHQYRTALDENNVPATVTNGIIQDLNGNYYNRAALQLINHGIKNPALRPFINDVINAVAQDHYLIPGISDILCSLSYQGFSVNIATNKGYIDFVRAAEHMYITFPNGMTKTLAGSGIIDTALVHHPPQKEIDEITRFLLFNMDFLPSSFKNVLKEFVNAEQGKRPEMHSQGPRMYYTDAMKPDYRYFEKMRSLSDKDYIVFFDDNKANIDAANNYGHGIIAVHVDSPADIIAFLKEHNLYTTVL